MAEKNGVFVGRFCPIHAGHEVVIGNMIEECGVDNSIIIIGSSNSLISLRHFFSYDERRRFLLTLFPNVRVVGLPDYSTDDEWILALDDILRAVRFNSKNTIFFGGCEEDIGFFLKARRKTFIVNRFNGTTPKISATEVRDALIGNRSLDGLLNHAIEKEVSGLFLEKWEKFKKM